MAMIPNPQGLVPAIGRPLRLSEEQQHQLVSAIPEDTFDMITSLVARMLGVPIAVVSIFDGDRISEIAIAPLGPGSTSATQGNELYLVPELSAWNSGQQTSLRAASELGLVFHATTPLIVAGHIVGTLSIFDAQRRTLEPAQMKILEDFGSLVVWDLELRFKMLTQSADEMKARNRSLSDIHHSDDLLKALQSALVPPPLPKISGVDLAVEFLPAEGYSIGGDFYDAFALPPSAWAVTIGDVCGKDSRAAGIAAAARYTLRAAALVHSSPARVLDLLNATLLVDSEFDDPRFCTAIHAQLEPHGAEFELTVASAGHPLPLIFRADGTVEPIGAFGLMAGAFSTATYSDRSTLLKTGDTVVFFTDGLTEAPQGQRLLGEAGVTKLVQSLAGSSPAQISARLAEAALAGAVERDDVTILVMGIGESRQAGDLISSIRGSVEAG
ncbi:hypothetical protein BH23ACT12_BH23ACT12_17240 [soil metagenome]